MQLIIKVCGMREPSNIAKLQELKVDWMGMIFFEKSARNVVKPIFIKKEIPRVGVFVNEEIDFILKKITDYELDLVQLHGDESVEFCKKIKDGLIVPFPKKIIKVFSVGNDFDFSILKPYETVVDYFLFDTKGENRGGNGVAFNWDILKKYNSEIPFLLSGGINSDSAEAIKSFQHPKMVGIDINSRFESEPALKDIKKIKTFIHELRSK